MADSAGLGLEVAERQLDRIQNFFPRIDSKVSALFAIASGQVAFAAINLAIDDLKIWWIAIPAVLFAAGIAYAIWNLYWCTFPHLDGGHKSLVYFREIAKLRESEYLEQYFNLNEASLTRDVVGQIWRNSQIVDIKYGYLRLSTISTMLSLLPWGALLLATTLSHWKLPIGSP